MTAARKQPKRDQPRGDYGPRVRLENGTAVLGYRADPEKPSAPLLRAARAYVAWEHMRPPLPRPEQIAAEQIENAAKTIMAGGGERSPGRTMRMGGSVPEAHLDAARLLRELRQVVGRRREEAVLRLVVDGDGRMEAEARDGLRLMAEWLGY
jgi:hypothetical protein